MTGEDRPPLDRAAILAALDRHQVSYVLVGGLACQAHGATRPTQDLDICPAWATDNLERVAAALRELDARILVETASIELPPDAKLIDNSELTNWETSAGQVDVLLGIPRHSRYELAQYEDLVANATVIQVDGLEIQVAGLRDIIRSKEIADRPKDRAALLELRMLEGRQRGPSGCLRRCRSDAPFVGRRLLLLWPVTFVAAVWSARWQQVVMRLAAAGPGPGRRRSYAVQRRWRRSGAARKVASARGVGRRKPWSSSSAWRRSACQRPRAPQGC